MQICGKAVIFHNHWSHSREETVLDGLPAAHLETAMTQSSREETQKHWHIIPVIGLEG